MISDRMAGLLARGAYRLLWRLLLPAVLLRLLWRARRQPDYRQHVRERFGYAGHPWLESSTPIIWVHAVSLGETRAAQPLIEALLAAYPRHRLLLTHMTPTGRAEGKRLFADRVQQVYLPYDVPRFVDRFLDAWRPAIGLLMETEVWPSLVERCHARQLPLLLVNARLSERSLRRALRVRSLSNTIFPLLTAVACQAASDAARFERLHVRRLHITGNLKFDVQIDAQQLAAGRAQRQALPHTRVLIFANTRDGEETMFFEALRRCPLPIGSLILLVPRHPQRFNAVWQMVQAHDAQAVRRSQAQIPGADTRIWLGDTLGEMPFYYGLADMALMGGSFAPLGGHNLIEACASGVPVLCGPHMFNFSQAASDAEQAGACLRVEDLDLALAQVNQLWRQPVVLQDMQAKAHAFVAQHRGATQRTLDVVRGFLAP